MALQSFRPRQHRTGARPERTRCCVRAFSQPLQGNGWQHPPASSFAEHMLALEAALPTMSCSQLAKTGASVRETYRAALLSTASAGAPGGSSSSSSGPDAMTRDLLDYFTSQLPNQSWLLTYRAAVEQHLQPEPQQQEAAAAVPAPSQSSCSPEHLAEILAVIAALPIQVVQPLPIGFGTPRWSRPMAAADPAAWEQWLSSLAQVYADALAQQLLQQQQQQRHIAAGDAADSSSSSSAACSPPVVPPDLLLPQLADFTICLACSMRWVNVNVDDDRLQTAEFRDTVLKCLRQQQHQEQQQAQPAVQPQQQEQQGAASSSIQQQQQQQQQQRHVPFALAGSLAHRLTYTCLLLLLPPPRPMLSAFFAATDPADFTLEQLQGVVRGLLFVGCAPPEPWLRGLVVLVRGRVGQMGQRELLGFVEAFRFFGTQVGRAPWLRDVTALMEEFSCVV